MNGKKMTEEDCLAMGGHCYVEIKMLMSDPPISVRACKHCGKVQHGRHQPSIRWE